MSVPLAPNCYGKKWDASAVECAGGRDLGYTHPVRGGNIRDQCRWHGSCAEATVKSKLASPQTLLRQPQPQPQQQQYQPQHRPVPPPQMQTPVQPQRQPQQYLIPQQQQQPPPPQMQPQVQQAYPGVPGPVMSAPQVAAVPMMVPMNYPAPGMQIPGYLSIPEPVVQGQSWIARLGWTLFRSMAKAAGHSASNFFDHTTMTAFPNEGNNQKPR